MLVAAVLFLAATATIDGLLLPAGEAHDYQADATSRDHSVAFSVGMPNSMHVTQGEVIMFNRVFTNLGNGMDPLSGVFTCPRSGLYMFHVHAYHSNTYKVMWLELFKDSEYLVSISGYNSHSSAGNAVITHVQQGQRVFLKSRPSQDFSLFGQSDEVYSTFTGFLLSPDSTVG